LLDFSLIYKEHDHQLYRTLGALCHHAVTQKEKTTKNVAYLQMARWELFWVLLKIFLIPVWKSSSCTLIQDTDI